MASDKNVVLAGYLIKSPPQEKLVAVSCSAGVKVNNIAVDERGRVAY